MKGWVSLYGVLVFAAGYAFAYFQVTTQPADPAAAIIARAQAIAATKTGDTDLIILVSHCEALVEHFKAMTDEQLAAELDVIGDVVDLKNPWQIMQIAHDRLVLAMIADGCVIGAEQIQRLRARGE